MTEVEFNTRMGAIDLELVARGVPVSQRLILAWFYLTGERTLCVDEEDPCSGPYEGPNLCWSVWDWYTSRYRTQVNIGYEWGPRLLVIRGEVFHAEIPVQFNPSSSLDAFKFLQGLSPALHEMLDADELAMIQAAYNRFFRQASDLVMNWTIWCAPRRHGLVSDLLDRGWRDLRTSCKAFSDRDPDAVLFTAQQGPEKYLKALIVVHDPAMTEDGLRKAYGHNIPKLLAACTHLAAGLSKFGGRIDRLNYGPDIRYHRQAMSAKGVVEVIDLAHDVCHAVAAQLLLGNAHAKVTYV